MIKKICIIIVMIFLVNCLGNTKEKDNLPDHDYLIGRWEFVRYVYQPVGRYVNKQYEQIIDRDLIITKDSIYFERPLSFIKPCGNFKWSFSKTNKNDLDLFQIEEDVEKVKVKIETNCREDIAVSYLKGDTLLSINGGIVTYRVKVATPGE